LSAVFLSLFVVIIWGVNPAISKLGLEELPPYTFLTIRYFIVACLFLPFAKPTRHELWQLFIVAITANVIANVLCYAAYEKLSPTASTLLMQTEGPISVLMACLWAKEHINRKQVLSILLSFVGVVVILGIPDINLWGAGFILFSRFFWGACQIVFKDTKHLPFATFLAYSSLFSVPFTAAGAFLVEDFNMKQLANVNWYVAGWVMTFEVVLLSIAMVVWQKLIAINGVNKIAPFSTLRIVFGIAAGVVIFGDRIDWQILLGAVLVTLGVILTLREFPIIVRARKRSKVVYRNARRIFMDRRLKRMTLRKKHL